MSLNTNQFKQAALVGQVDLSVTANEALFTCRYSSEASANIVEGTGVKLKDLAGDDSIGPPIVDVLPDDNDNPFGIKIFTTKKNDNEAGDIVQIATDGAVVFMNAGAAIARGASLALVNATPGNVVTATTEDIIGIALDKASGADVLIRVLVKVVAVST